MNGFLRKALSRDAPAIQKILRPWTEKDPSVAETLEAWFRDRARGPTRCTVLEMDKTVRAACLWTAEQRVQVNVRALGASPERAETEIETRLLREQILDWTRQGIVRAKVRAPETIPGSVLDSLRQSGFLFEGRPADWDPGEKPRLRLSKYFLYRTVPQGQLVDFLQELMISMGYEVRQESTGFRYRVREEFRRPFLFAQWHEITVSGSDLIMHPPARVLEWHELETLFYPLRICGQDERPLLLPMEKRRAEQLVDLSQHDLLQKGLFDESGECEERALRFNNLTYCHPVGRKPIRKGLPILFYVNRIGAVGVGRVQDAYLDEPANVCRKLEETGEFDPEDVMEHAAAQGPRTGMVQVITFQWYQPFGKAVSLEEIRGIDPTFNPQRTRLLSGSLFDAIVSHGKSQE